MEDLPIKLFTIFEAIISTIGVLGVPYFGYLQYKLNRSEKEKKKLKSENNQRALKLSYIPQIMQLKSLETIETSIDFIFKNTRTTRFVVFVGVNGFDDVHNISVLYSKNKNEVEIDQTKAYTNVPTDKWGKKMLKEAERFGYSEIDVFEMPQSQAKSVYYKEGISHSLVEFVSRTPLDEKNDFLLFCSFATDEEEKFPVTEKLLINSILKDSIIPTLESLGGKTEKTIN